MVIETGENGRRGGGGSTEDMRGLILKRVRQRGGEGKSWKDSTRGHKTVNGTKMIPTERKRCTVAEKAECQCKVKTVAWALNETRNGRQQGAKGSK